MKSRKEKNLPLLVDARLQLGKVLKLVPGRKEGRSELFEGRQEINHTIQEGKKEGREN
jgi:hypothetical protein